MVAVIGGFRGQGAKDISLGADLPAARGVGRHRLVGVRKVVHGETVAAGAVLDHGVRVDAPGRVIDQLEDAGQLAGALLGSVRMMGRVVIRRDGVHVLAVELEALVAVFPEELLHEPPGLGLDVRIHRREVPAVPIGDFHGLPVRIQDRGIRMLLQELRPRIRDERRPP